MKANELMYGDLIKQGKVTCVCDTFVHVTTFPDCIYDDRMSKSHPYIKYFIEPLLLTVDFLKLNNFIQDNHYWYRYGDIEVYPATNKGSFCDLDHPIVNIQRYGEAQELHLRCDYVHTFQHILRLHGYEELADNLKVE